MLWVELHENYTAWSPEAMRALCVNLVFTEPSFREHPPNVHCSNGTEIHRYCSACIQLEIWLSKTWNTPVSCASSTQDVLSHVWKAKFKMKIILAMASSQDLSDTITCDSHQCVTLFPSPYWGFHLWATSNFPYCVRVYMYIVGKIEGVPQERNGAFSTLFTWQVHMTRLSLWPITIYGVYTLHIVCEYWVHARQFSPLWCIHGLPEMDLPFLWLLKIMVQPLEDYPPRWKFTGMQTCTVPAVFMALLLC